ncbi:MAG: S-methyl-5-thioribose-1-phosphate isomerase [Lachnospiraceae bacterium]|nr:S-methyl-5-thioribose-1-phosphate isomerase [Lachnospiraceae bacterium]
MKRLAELTKRWKDEGLLMPIWMEENQLCMVNQLKLPHEMIIVAINEVEELAEAIRTMAIRGSGAIGIAGVYGMLLECRKSKGNKARIVDAGRLLSMTRPTAVNLIKTIQQMTDYVNQLGEGEIEDLFEEKACDILENQLAFEKQLGENGAELIDDGDAILTHCHSGALAGSGFGGRALSVIRTAFLQGKRIHVYTCETRPYLQGARITAFELEKFGIPHTLITDGMPGYLMELGKIQKVIVGSDRVAANGDLINKVGTYMHAVAAKENGVPFYTATSAHTIDFQLRRGLDLEVEYRPETEVTYINGQMIAAEGTKALYPAFDVTPNRFISGIITEAGVIRQPFGENLNKLR